MSFVLQLQGLNVKPSTQALGLKSICWSTMLHPDQLGCHIITPSPCDPPL